MQRGDVKTAAMLYVPCTVFRVQKDVKSDSSREMHDGVLWIPAWPIPFQLEQDLSCAPAQQYQYCIEAGEDFCLHACRATSS